MTKNATVGYKLIMSQTQLFLVWALVGWITAAFMPMSHAAEEIPRRDHPAPTTVQIFRASDWKGATDTSFEDCKANSGEYTLWVYAKGTRCGVPREQADRVVIFRQPLPGVSPVRTVSRLPEGRYAVWVYGAGDPGHPWVNICGKTCVKGELPSSPDWVSLDWIDVKENHMLFMKSSEQPDGHQLYVQAVMLSSRDARPDWTP